MSREKKERKKEGRKEGRKKERKKTSFWQENAPKQAFHKGVISTRALAYDLAIAKKCD